MYRNIAGSLPSNADRTYHMDFLQGSSGTLTQAELLMVAAATAANDANIGPAGYQQTGVEFV